MTKTKYLVALAIIVAVLTTGVAFGQSFTITCPGGVVFATPTANGGMVLLCVAYTPTPTATHTPTATATPTNTPVPTATKTPLPPTATPTPAATNAPVVAFPGAEGWGAASVGGRGGRVIEVTNLADSGTGSLRACVIATGPRVCVFKVAGTITLATHLVVANPFVTIAGQTAPGGGIALRNGTNTAQSLGITASDVIVRYLRIRPGPPITTSATVDAVNVYGTARRVMLDHLSMSFGDDEQFNTWDTASDITLQWSFIENGLCNGWHPDTHPHCDSLYIGDGSTRVSVHHNLLAHNDQRNPRITGGDIDFVNNVSYDAGTTPAHVFDIAGSGAARYNFVGNYFKRGPASYWTIEFKCAHDGTLGIGCYLHGNIGPDRPNNTLPESNIADAASYPYLVTTRYAFPQVTTTDAFAAYDQVLANGGATRPLRDSLDARIVAEVQNGTGGFIDNPSEVGGYPVLPAGTGYTDSDHDGMSDTWETAHGLNPSDATDGAKVSPNGYTNLENFLNELTSATASVAGTENTLRLPFIH